MNKAGVDPQEVRSQVLLALSEAKAESGLLHEAKLLPEPTLLTFIADVDDSQYSLQEWSQAIVAFDQWAIEQKRQLSLPSKIEYLCCCVQGTVKEGRLLSLLSVWETYVQNYGVE